MYVLIPLHFLLAFALAAILYGARRRPRWFFGVEFWILILLPGFGAVVVTMQILVDAVFFRKVAPTNPETLFGLHPMEAPLEDVDEVKSWRDEADAPPLRDLLETGDAARIERAMRRLAWTETPESLSRLKEALRYPDPNIQFSARALLSRTEDRIIQRIRRAKTPLARGQGYAKLGLLSPDLAMAGRSLHLSAEMFEQALKEDPESPAAAEYGDVLLQLGDYARARTLFEGLVEKHPEDVRGHIGRIEASFRLGDIGSVRRYCVALSEFGEPYVEMVKRWDFDPTYA